MRSASRRSRSRRKNSDARWSCRSARIVNTSPLILLARVGYLELLREPPDADTTVPDVVVQEILAGAPLAPKVQATRLASGTWLHDVPTPQPAPRLDPNRLDPGELGVLSLAIENPRA